jgi:hypothetical protein
MYIRHIHVGTYIIGAPPPHPPLPPKKKWNKLSLPDKIVQNVALRPHSNYRHFLVAGFEWYQCCPIATYMYMYVNVGMLP